MAQNADLERLTRTEREIALQVDRQVEEAIRFLERVVNINSGTMNHEGVRLAGLAFEAELAPLGFDCRWIPLTELDRSGHLFAELDGGRGKRILLIGHLDTVFEKESSFQRFRRGKHTATGPGVEDMKGGDVVMLFALKALHAVGALRSTRLVVALIGDEEDSGEPVEAARRDLVEAARRSQIALGFESAGADHRSVTVARRGFSQWQLETSGKRGHSSRIFHRDFGAGAIYEAARILNEFYRELSSEPHLTLGPGIILGGTNVHYDASHTKGDSFGKSNVIPQKVVASGDLRYMTQQQCREAQARMAEIAARNLPLTASKLNFRDSYPAMPPRAGNYDLMDQLDRVSRDLGFGRVHPYDPDERGAADISFVADYVEACLDGLGPAGWGGHSPQETIDLKSFPIQIKRAAILIHRLSGGSPD